MRYVTAFAVAAHIAIAFVACFDPFSPKELEAPAPPLSAVLESAEPEMIPAETLSVAQLESIDREVDRLMVAVQQDEKNVSAMIELARLYAGQRWFDRAIGPLARAAEVEPGRTELFVELGIVLARAGYASAGDVDLAAAALDFVETVAMWGHGC